MHVSPVHVRVNETTGSALTTVTLCVWALVKPPLSLMISFAENVPFG